jgi:hypothetical protein
VGAVGQLLEPEHQLCPHRPHDRGAEHQPPLPHQHSQDHRHQAQEPAILLPLLTAAPGQHQPLSTEHGTRLSARCHFTGPKKLSNSRAQPPPTFPRNGSARIQNMMHEAV